MWRTCDHIFDEAAKPNNPILINLVYMAEEKDYQRIFFLVQEII